MKVTLEDFNNLIKSVNRGGYFRCSICDCVSNESIATEPDHFKPNMPFVNDPKDPLHFICVACDEEIQDLRIDYQFQDDEKEKG